MHTVIGLVILLGETLLAQGIQLQAGITPIDCIESGELNRILDVRLIEIGVALHAGQSFLAVYGIGVIARIDIHAPRLAVIQLLFETRIGVTGQARFIADRLRLLEQPSAIGGSGRPDRLGGSHHARRDQQYGAQYDQDQENPGSSSHHA
jgi:hypothetical protein